MFKFRNERTIFYLILQKLQFQLFENFLTIASILHEHFEEFLLFHFRFFFYSPSFDFLLTKKKTKKV